MIYKNQKDIFIEKNYKNLDGSDLPLLEFQALSKIPGMKHCFTTRDGGVSQGIYQSLNLSFTRGDDKACVTDNYQRVAQAMGSSISNIVTSDQTHTTNVRRVGGEDAGSGVIKPRSYHDVDGMITNEKGLLLATFYADCVPLYFVDPIKRVIGLSHSGWKGTVHRMGQATIDAMHREFGCEPQDIIACIGPSICMSCYEVSEDVAAAFIREFPGQEGDLLLNHGNGKYQLDLWKANEMVLLDAGITKAHLTTTNLCTCCNPTKLFSHRASHGKRGNLGAFLMLTE